MDEATPTHAPTAAPPEIGTLPFYPDPYPTLAARRRESGYRSVPGTDGAIGVFGSRDVIALLEGTPADPVSVRTFFPVPDPDLSAYTTLDRWLSLSLLRTAGDTHRRLRDLIDRPLAAISVQRYAGHVQTAVDGVLADVPTAGPLETIGAFAARVPSDAVAALLGIPPERYPAVREAADALARWTDNAHRTRRDTEYARAAVERLGQWLLEAASAPEAPLLSAVLARTGATTGTAEQAFAQAILFLIASRATLRHLIGSALLLTLSSPATRTGLADGTLTALAVVDETLRYESPIQYVRRTVAADFEGDRGRIPAGSPVLLALGSAMRDPAYADDPDRFDPTRTAPPTLAFGLAERACAGRALARLIAAAALESFLRHRPTVALAGTPRWGRTLYYRGMAELPLDG